MAMTTVGPVCPACGARSIARTRDPVTVEMPAGNQVVEGFEYEHCGACGEDFFFPGQPDAIRAAASESVRQQQGLLAPGEIRRLRSDLGLTQTDLERILGVGEKTVGRWERGLYCQTRPADTLMRLLGAHPELVAETGFVAREGRGPYRTRSR
jgi:putative zinc finger/helix-turn-helix YgiT family protein